MKKPLLYPAAVAVLLSACTPKAATVTSAPGTLTKEAAANAMPAAWREQAEAFLTSYNEQYQALYTKSSEAEWQSNTHIVPGDGKNAEATAEANQALAAFTGSTANIKRISDLLKHKAELDPMQVKQLQTALYNAGNNPEIAGDVVAQRIKAEAAQTEKLYGFEYKLHTNTVTTNDLDQILRTEKDLKERRAAWEASKTVGPTLRDGLLNLRDLRNGTVKALEYPDFFSYQVSDYGMDREQMLELVRQLNNELRPLYRELHTYARYELAKKYGQKEVPDYLPADWLPNRWGQDWSAMVDVDGLNLDAVLAKKGPEWQVQQAERFYVSLGYPSLPKSFYELSSLYPLPADAGYKKNNHASAWHMDLEQDVRSLMSVEPNTEWYETTHHELGHIYYYLTYSNPNVPLVLRQGANRAFHEAMGSLMGLAATQRPFLESLQLVQPYRPSKFVTKQSGAMSTREAAPAGTPTTMEEMQVQTLLKEALNYVVFIPFASGVMTEWENDFYANNLPASQLNKRWWELVKQYQGIVPPETRGEEFLDPATKTHINDDAAQYYDYALSYVILFQLHNHIATDILHQDPHATNYYGNAKVGDFLQSIMRPGATADWQQLLQEKTGSQLSAKAMVKYFEPLMTYLQKENKGRKYTM